MGGKPFNGASRGSEVRNRTLLRRRFAIAFRVGWVGVEIRRQRGWLRGGGGGARLRVLRWQRISSGVAGPGVA
ncbi:hypothetical protein H4N54_07420 [Limnospira fusiformis KN01]|nr:MULTISPECIES: hypothetical protein [Limnospira]MDY7051894.1 hypothetical protein [Limnospira fusiformis LS22]QJB25848.1 hypothetical protein HFV01_08595 [Limnospira fusiformis SAG 85.79]ULB47153.1 hypothetical protein H4N54_07420 [Limnospira fusiformis KN01]